MEVGMEELGAVEKKLKACGYKLTEQRKIIIEFFQEKPGHYTACEIFEQVKSRCKTINFSTIYRNLELLSSLKIVNKLYINDGVSHYELSGMGHHHHIICKNCGDMKEIDVCPYESISNDKLDELGFMPTEHKFEIYGYCKNCSTKK